MPVVARHLMILGRVQGVFYRNWTVDAARGLGLTGWVRNRMDGSVEALVQGEADMVDHFVTLARDLSRTDAYATSRRERGYGIAGSAENR